jgi:hypothetical protein
MEVAIPFALDSILLRSDFFEYGIIKTINIIMVIIIRDQQTRVVRSNILPFKKLDRFIEFAEILFISFNLED